VAGAIVGGAAAVLAGGRTPARPWKSFSDAVDAAGLGAYACVGAQMSLQLGLGVPSAIFIGVVNGVGGGLLRDVLINRVWMLPGQLLAVVAFAGVTIFVGLLTLLHWSPASAAWTAIGVTFVLRVLAIRFDWRTRALLPGEAGDEE
ncbi:MAG TPA: TRIC cation channel family protein, partial [Candidatus Acidoferrales bacterium]|nr:TRIC cation channel family protein [Candidatus Acidoferrales bacterium]